MALLCPVETAEPDEYGCVGHFFSLEESHLVTSHRGDLILRRLVYPFNQTARLCAVRCSTIWGLYRAPSWIQSGNVPNGLDRSGLDLLVINVRPWFDGNQRNNLHFWAYNLQTQEFDEIAIFSCVTTLEQLRLGTTFSVCDFAGPQRGTVAFASGSVVHIFHPSDCANEVTHSINKDIAVFPPRLHWVSSRKAVITCISGQLEFLKIERHRENSTHELSVTPITMAESHIHGGSVEAVSHADGPPHRTTVHTVSGNGTVNTYLVADKNAECVHTMRYGDEQEVDHESNPFHTLVSRFEQGYSWEFVSNGGFRMFISINGTVLMLSVLDHFCRCSKIVNLPQDSRISYIGLGIFKIYRPFDGVAQYGKLTTVRNGNSFIFEISFFAPKVRFCSTAVTLCKYGFSETSGSSFYHYCYSKNDISCSLICRYPRPLRKYPLEAPVVGMWFVAHYLVISTASRTEMFKLNGTSMERTPSKFDGDFQTLAASPEMQITPQSIHFFDSGQSIPLPLDSPVAGMICGSHAAVHGIDTVVVVNGGGIHDILKFEEVVIGVSIQSSMLATCTTNALHILNMDIGHSSVFKLPNMLTAIASDTIGSFYVGDIKGGIFFWPENRYETVAASRIVTIRVYKHELVIVAADPSDNVVFNPRTGTSSRLACGFASDIYFSPFTNQCLVLKRGIVLVFDLAIGVSLQSQGAAFFPDGFSMIQKEVVADDQIHLYGTCSEKWVLITTSILHPTCSSMLTISSDRKGYTCRLPAVCVLLGPSKVAELTLMIQIDTREVVLTVNVFEARCDRVNDKALYSKSIRTASKLGKLNVTKVGLRAFIVSMVDSISIFVGFRDTFEPFFGNVERYSPTFVDFSYISDEHGLEYMVRENGDVFQLKFEEKDGIPLLHSLGGEDDFIGNLKIDGQSFCRNVTKLGNSFDTDLRVMVANNTMEGCMGAVGVTISQINEDFVERLGEFYMMGECLLLPIDAEKARSMCAADNDTDTGYNEALVPEGIVHNGLGHVAFLSMIKDHELQSALQGVQNRIFEECGLIDAAQAKKYHTWIDGSIILTALQTPGSEELFAEYGLDTAGLARALISITQ